MSTKTEKEARERTEQQRYPHLFFTNSKDHPKDRILIHESSKIPREGQFVGLNGIQYLMKPGFEIDVPRPVRLMLDTRIETETIQGEDGKDYHRDIRRINYTLIKENVGVPEPEVIDASKKNPKSQEKEENF